ncbi:putative membrane protein [Elusimicrobium posterum]|uniref:hypothetical protein n=1 Tax=Elusimicrobium posterum TaxID=3116653 RepID=UPI003C761739
MFTKQRLEKFFFAACVLLGLGGIIARCFYMPQSLSYDEMFTAATSQNAHSLSYIIKNFLMPDVHPPLFNFVMYLWGCIVPFKNEIIVRAPSFIFSISALAAAWFYFPFKENKTQRIIFTTFMAVSSYPVVYASDARSYSLLLLLSTILTFFTVNTARKIYEGAEIKNKEFVIYFILSLLISYTHYYGSLLAGCTTAVLMAYALYKKKYFFKISAAYIPVFILISLWIAPQIMFNQGHINGGWWGIITML